MARVQSALRVSVSILTWLSGALMLVVPLWFVVAAFGAKWNFIDWRFALDIMVHQAGFTLLLTALVTGVLGLIMIAIHRVVMREWFGVIMAPAVAIIIAGVGLGWAYTFEEARSSLPVLLDVTTDTADPPHFSANTRTRRNAFGVPIDYAAHRGEDGRPYAQIQLETYPLIASWDSDQAPQDAYSKAIRTARYMGLHIGAASETAGMFEATDEEFWFGFRDDIIVRVRETELGGARIDIRSIARQPVNDLGRNARRVQEFLTLLDEDELVY